MLLGQLQRRVDQLEDRIKELTRNNNESLKKKRRRKVAEIDRSFRVKFS